MRSKFGSGPHLQVLVQFGAGRALDAVIRPQGLVQFRNLIMVGKFDDVEHLKGRKTVMLANPFVDVFAVSETNRQFGAALFDDPVLSEVGVGEEGDVVPGVPVDGVHDDVKVVGGLAKEIVERADDLEPVLLGGGVSEGERACLGSDSIENQLRVF